MSDFIEVSHKKAERSTCGSGGCISCPFSCTDEAFYAENTGCLPTQYEILELPKTRNVVWGCHSDTNVICGGFAKEFIEQGNELDINLPIVDFDEYTFLGMDTAIALAKVRKGINPVIDENKHLIQQGHDKHYFDYSKMIK